MSSGGLSPAVDRRRPRLPGTVGRRGEAPRVWRSLTVSRINNSREQAEDILTAGDADLIAICARHVVRPALGWHAADALGADRPQYLRSPRALRR